MPDVFLSVSATTRPARWGEIEAVDYFFLSEEAFMDMVEQDQFLEYARVYHHYYGTPTAFVTDHLRQGRDVLLEIDVQGARQIRQKMPGTVFIFIYPPSLEVLAQRLRARGKDSGEVIAKRLAASEEELTYINDYNYAVNNDYLDIAADKVRAIIVAERCKVKKKR
jgi:guanylate kinase